MDERKNEKKNGHGGARPGAGRKPADIPRRRHTVYCNMEELYCIKTMLSELRKIEKAQKKITQSKGNKIEYDSATISWLETEKEVNAVTIGQFREAFQKELEKMSH